MAVPTEAKYHPDLAKLAMEDALIAHRYGYDARYSELIMADRIFADIGAGKEFPVHWKSGRMVFQSVMNYEFFERHHIERINPIEEMMNLLEQELKEELEMRRSFIRDYIKIQGLEKHTREIIEGMNKTCHRVTIGNDYPVRHPINVRVVSLHDSFALLQFGLNYVDRWKMYNELWGKK
jgi:hypothetical protein